MLNDYTPISQYFAELIGDLSTERDNRMRAEAQARGVSPPSILREAAGDGCSGCETGCAGGCSGSCSGSCTSSCENNCSGGCKGTCTANCADNCTDTCKGECAGACKGGCKTGCSADCKGDCNGVCKGTCSDTCDGACVKVCTGMCEDKCQSCQTFCQNNQSYTTNRGNKSPNGKTFSWSSTVAQGQTILISAANWNSLVAYVRAAAPYCANSTPSLSTATSNAPITAAIFNNLDTGIGTLGGSGRVGNKTANIDIIKAADFQALASHYNAAKIKSNLECCQLGETPESEYGHNQPCKNKQTCSTTDGGKGQSCTENSQKGPQVGK